MKWLKNLWHGKKTGAFVEVFMDYGFGAITDPIHGTQPFPHVLHITDLSAALAKKALAGKRFDWHAIHSHWRHDLEIGGLHASKWEEVQRYLKEEK